MGAYGPDMKGLGVLVVLGLITGLALTLGVIVGFGWAIVHVATHLLSTGTTP